MNQGEADAIAAIAQGEGKSLQHLVHYHHMKLHNDERINNMLYGDFVNAKLN